MLWINYIHGLHVIFLKDCLRCSFWRSNIIKEAFQRTRDMCLLTCSHSNYLRIMWFECPPIFNYLLQTGHSLLMSQTCRKIKVIITHINTTPYNPYLSTIIEKLFSTHIFVIYYSHVHSIFTTIVVFKHHICHVR